MVHDGIDEGHRLGPEVAPAVLPLVVLLEEDHPDETDQARAGREDPVAEYLAFLPEHPGADLRGPEEFVMEVWFVDTRTAARKDFKYMDYTFKRKK